MERQAGGEGQRLSIQWRQAFPGLCAYGPSQASPALGSQAVFTALPDYSVCRREAAPRATPSEDQLAGDKRRQSLGIAPLAAPLFQGAVSDGPVTASRAMETISTFRRVGTVGLDDYMSAGMDVIRRIRSVTRRSIVNSIPKSGMCTTLL